MVWSLINFKIPIPLTTLNKIGFPILSLVLLGLSPSNAQVAADCANAAPICNNSPINGGTMEYGIDDFNWAVFLGVSHEPLVR
ncbi:hypothetical protein ACNR9Q_07825 [Maribacter sp. X9]|uniref:hypothetical protein n=1 Tax=Maribacter sp. X9 TaxID=3402159 RepID=UPI003AF340EF